MPKARQGARPYRRKDNPARKAIVAQVIPDIRNGVSIQVLAARHGVAPWTLSYWLRHSIDAYHNRLYAITNYQQAREGQNEAFHKRRRLERLVTYRRLNNMPPNPSPRRKKLPEQTPSDTPSVDREF